MSDEEILRWVRRALDQMRGAENPQPTPTDERIAALRLRVEAGRDWYSREVQKAYHDATFYRHVRRYKELRGEYYALIRACPHTSVRLWRQDAANGTPVVKVWCLACDRGVLPTGYTVAHSLLRRVGIDPHSVPVNPAWDATEHEMCAHCKEHKPGEWHHFAPRARFSDPEEWPMAYLCLDCHRRWHDVMGWGNEKKGA